MIKKGITFGICVLMLTFLAPPAAAAGSCTANASLTGGTGSCSIFWCNTGERLSVTVFGAGASGRVTGCGQSAGCSTGLALSCTATSSPIGSGWSFGTGVCSVSGVGATANCASA